MRELYDQVDLFKLLICKYFSKINGSNSIEFNELLIRKSLVRAQVEEPDKAARHM